MRNEMMKISDRDKSSGRKLGRIVIDHRDRGNWKSSLMPIRKSDGGNLITAQ